MITTQSFMDGRATPLVLLDDTACSVCVETQKIRYLPSSIPIVPITLRSVLFYWI